MALAQVIALPTALPEPVQNVRHPSGRYAKGITVIAKGKWIRNQREYKKSEAARTALQRSMPIPCSAPSAARAMPNAAEIAAHRPTPRLEAQAAAARLEMMILSEICSKGDDWKHGLWTVAFVTDSQYGCPPIVRRIGGK